MTRHRTELTDQRAGLRRRRLFAAGSALTAAIGLANAAYAQETAPPDPPPAPAPEENSRQIVVIGDRAIIAALQDAEVEQTYDVDRVGSYAVGTVGELIDAVTGENGDEGASILINGEPVSDPGNIADLPIEAVRRIEVLPRGSAERIGGPAGRRAYNVVLQNSVRSATFTASRQFATAGDWAYSRGEVLFTWIKGQERLNLAFRASGSDMLLEADRGVIPVPETAPFSAIGNVYPALGSTVDPALNLLAGQPVTSVALPAGNTLPTLASLIPGVNRTHASILGLARSLRGETAPYEVSLTGNKVLAPWLSLSFGGRLSWADTTNLTGLPAARFQITSANAFTPFTVPVILALNDPARPLRNRTETSGSSANLTFNANLDDWRATFLAKTEERNRTNRSELTGAIPGGSLQVPVNVNPFAGSLAATIPIRTRLSRSTTTISQLGFDVEGPVFDMPAGKLRFRAGLGVTWVALDASDETNGPRSFRRREVLSKAGVTIPLTGRDPDFLPGLGETELTLEAARVDLGQFGSLERHSLALNWNPLGWLRLSASEVQDDRATPPELLAASTTITEGVAYFDPLTNSTARVTLIYGGGGNLDGERQRTRTLSLSASPLARYNLLLTADYLETELRNQFGALPSPSSAVMLAFPDRFVRDGNGQLVLVDSRTVNFDRQNNRLLRLGLAATIPLSGGAANQPAGPAATRRTILQLNLSQNFLLESKTVIRQGLGEIDLLTGGAIGIGGSQARHATDLNLALTRGGNGLRLNTSWRGRNFLRTGTALAPDLLTFSPVLKFDLKLFAELNTVFPNQRLLRNTRLTVSFDNLGDHQQLVRNNAGVTPIAFQPAYRDPIGRTFTIELRKVF